MRGLQMSKIGPLGLPLGNVTGKSTLGKQGDLHKVGVNRMLQLSLVRLVEIVGSGPQLEHDRHRCQPHVARLV